jgi:hypothetical protein
VQFEPSLLSDWSTAERLAAEAEHALVTKTSNASGPGSFPSPLEFHRARQLRQEAIELMHQVLAHLKAVADEMASQNPQSTTFTASQRQGDAGGIFQPGDGSR